LLVLKYFGKIKKGKIIFDNKAKLINDLSKLNDDIKVVIEIREAKDVRTNQQNKLWWSWMNTIGESIGYSSSEIHEILKYKFLMKEEMIDGEMHQSLKSTTTLTKKEFNKLTNDVLYWANDTLNINLPNE
tara:strand:+ start:110 stop:499 length:390 start_codon:yes stop_codon:yes gene_type:complete